MTDTDPLGSTDDADPDPDDTTPASVGERMGAAVAALLAFLMTGIKAPFIGFWKRMKGGASLGESLIVAGYQIRKRSNDVIVNVIYEDGVVKPRSGTYHSDESYFETDNGERFSAKGLGYNPRRLAGKVPVVWACRVGSEVTEPLESAIARARRRGNFEQFQRADGDEDIAVDVNPNAIHNQEQAVADGGAPNMDGLVISFREGYELFGSKVGNEDLKQAETRGKLAALDFRDVDTWKWILAVLGAAALGLFGPSLAASIAGGASSGMGGGISLPLMLGVMG